ncbi:MAG: class II fumarate hydratase, partial [Chlamydiae bacterium]|nr:class II fumarate hydratase [Chlamydiota bacterium]
ISGGNRGDKTPIHPNDHVNKSQSSNDVFPTAAHVAATLEVERKLLPAFEKLKNALYEKEKEYADVVKIGRTHLMDATPMTLGQEFSAFRVQLENSIEEIKNKLPKLREIALGGTAVGTGLNAPKGYAEKVAERLSLFTGTTFITAPNKFQALSTIDAQIALSGALKNAAIVLMKLANDIRLLGSGPRSGIGELILPANEPGSSIMPGKVNPTQSECLTQIAAQVIGNDVSIGFSGASGQLQLNVFRPMVIYNLLQSIKLLSDGAENFVKRCIHGMRPNLRQIQSHLDKSLMLVTALAPQIGYDNSAKIAKLAYDKHLTLKQAALELELISEEEFDRLVDPRKML